MSRDDLEKLLEQKVEELKEHFEHVQIFVSREVDEADGQGGEGTQSISKGAGNWWARIGYVKDWILYHDEQTRESARDKE